jgi:hypothetical protein
LDDGQPTHSGRILWKIPPFRCRQAGVAATLKRETTPSPQSRTEKIQKGILPDLFEKKLKKTAPLSQKYP